MANPQSGYPTHERDVVPNSPDNKKAKQNRANALPVLGVVQNYAWGKPWESSIVASIQESVSKHRFREVHRAAPLDKGRRFAELWMGTHPNGPSFVTVSNAPGESRSLYLKELIEEDPVHWLGEEDADKGDLPFLFKVLSVQQALSIQAHPNKTLAAKLHAQKPFMYPDSNHKPEIALPLGHFEALCGFRPVEEIRTFVREVEELGRLCCDPSAELRELYTSLLSNSEDAVIAECLHIAERLKDKENRSKVEDLILRLVQDYPIDIGLFSVFFLNYVVITADMPNRFIFCAPDEPHAYLAGDCVECMALSDNVVRAGLTPKPKDVETLLSMMTYRDDLLDSLVNVGEEVEPNLFKYAPQGIDDFIVYEITGSVPEGLELSRASIMICVTGKFVMDFQSVIEKREGMPPAKASQVKEITYGMILFCRAGTTVVPTSPNRKASNRLFIATYQNHP